MKVSVVIPAFNEQEYVSQALQSVLELNYPLQSLEAVVADNGSTDATFDLVTRFAEQHPEIAVQLVSEPIAGVGRAKNAGAAAATGDLLIFVDADSRVEPGLATAVVEVYQPDAPIGSLKVLTDSKHWIDRAFFGLMEFGKERFGVRAQMLYCDAALFRELGGFDPDLKLGEDLELLRRARALVTARGAQIAHVRTAGIITSPRRLHRWPMHLGILPMFGRWLMAFFGLGRKRKY